MRLLRALLCILGKHHPGEIDPEWSIAWVCIRCAKVNEGRLSKHLRRWP